jgi:hypothetical protein
MQIIIKIAIKTIKNYFLTIFLVFIFFNSF